MKTTSTILSLALAAGLLATLQACTDSKGERKPMPAAAEPVPVKLMPLKQSSSTETITASGQLTTDDETVLSFKLGGVVGNVLVKEGERVRKGQLLATLALTEINAQVTQARLAYEKAQRDLNRVNNLYRDSVATLEQLQNVQTSVDIAKQQLDAAAFNRSFAEIHAPADGFVLRKFVNPGQVVSTGNPVLITNGAAKGNWILKVGVSDRQWAAIPTGTKAEIIVDAFPGRAINGKVIRKSETADAVNGAFTVEVQLSATDVKLAAGMFGRATLHGGTAATTWTVPYEAVLDANGNEGFVFVTADNKVAHKQPVTIAGFDGNSVHISHGLENAQSIVVAGSAYLTDESPILIQP